MAEKAGGWGGVSLWLLSQHRVDTETAGEYHYSSTGVYGVLFVLQQADASHFFSVFLLILKCSQLESNGIVMVYSDIMIGTSSPVLHTTAGISLRLYRQNVLSMIFDVCFMFVFCLFACSSWLYRPDITVMIYWA